MARYRRRGKERREGKARGARKQIGEEMVRPKSQGSASGLVPWLIWSHCRGGSIARHAMLISYGASSRSWCGCVGQGEELIKGELMIGRGRDLLGQGGTPSRANLKAGADESRSSDVGPAGVVHDSTDIYLQK